jgi:hypothetical protein
LGLEEAPEDAHAAEITSSERVRRRAPAILFMATPHSKLNPDDPWFVDEYTAPGGWIEAAGFF